MRLTGEERAIVSPIAGTTRDAVDETVVERDGTSYVFVDTAGIRRKGKTKLMAEKLSVVMARRHLRMANVVLLVLDATEGVHGAGRDHRRLRARRRPGVIICVNKWDASRKREKNANFRRRARRVQVSGICAGRLHLRQEKRGVKALFPLIRKAYESFNQRITTGELNRFVETLHWEYDMKIYYMTQASSRPPTFIVFTDKAGKMHFSAERFINRLREKFGFEGSPIVIKTRRR